MSLTDLNNTATWPFPSTSTEIINMTFESALDTNLSMDSLDPLLDSLSTLADNGTTTPTNLFDGLGDQFTNSPKFYIM